MAGKNASFSVDGFAMSTNLGTSGKQTASSKQQPGVIDPNVLLELNDLRRKLERREAELKRKDKDVLSLQKEIARYQNDAKASGNELSGLQERNEQLQQSLMSSRLLTQEARDDADSRIKNSKIRELEVQLSASVFDGNSAKGELEASRLTVKSLQDEHRAIIAILDNVRAENASMKQEVYTTVLKSKTMEIRLADKVKECLKLQDEVVAFREAKISTINATETLTCDLAQRDKKVTELESTVSRLQHTIDVRSETNLLLREQMEDINDNKYVVTKSEMDRFKKIESDKDKLVARSKSLSKSVELHMDLLKRAEAEVKTLKEQLQETTASLGKYKNEFIELSTSKGADATTLRNLKKEIVILRRENKEFKEALAEMRKNPLGRDEQVIQIKQGIVNLARHKQEEIEGRKEEKSRRLQAEDGVKALRNRISFLLEQVEHITEMSVQWKDQKAILKSEISALHATNLELRQRLVNSQRTFMNKNVYEMTNSARLGQSRSAFLTEYTGPVDNSYPDDTMNVNVHGTSGNNGNGHGAPADPLNVLIDAGGANNDFENSRGHVPVSALGGVFADPAPTNTLPETAHSVVERALFDTVCAFTCGSRSNMANNRKAKKPVKSVFKARHGDDGLMEIYVDSSISGTNASAYTSYPDEVVAAEILAGLQIDAFLKFCQGRPEAKIPAIFTEKMASILNFTRKSIYDTMDQLGSSRMQVATIQASLSVAQDNMSRMRLRFSKERVAKQKTVMKYIREQMRHSDLRIMIDEVCQKAKAQLEDVQMEQDDLSGPAYLLSKELLRQMVLIAEDLASAGASSRTSTGPVGSLELRIPESQIDDETLHGIIGLLCGVLMGSGNGIDDGMTAGPNVDYNGTMAASATLSKMIISTDCIFTQRVLLLNLKDNQLTDLSCKVLCGLVEKSNQLRMLDLRGNLISPAGAQLLFDATRKNPSVLYVTQKQNGFMVEGHREIIGSKKPVQTVDETGQYYTDLTDADRLIGGAASAPGLIVAKHPLRIDIRSNNPDQELLMDLLDMSKGQKKTTAHRESPSSADRNTRSHSSSNYRDRRRGSGSSVGSNSDGEYSNRNTPTKYRSPSPGNRSNTMWSSRGIADIHKQPSNNLSIGFGTTKPSHQLPFRISPPHGNSKSSGDIIHLMEEDLDECDTTRNQGYETQADKIGSLVDDKIRQMQRKTNSVLSMDARILNGQTVQEIKFPEQQPGAQVSSKGRHASASAAPTAESKYIAKQSNLARAYEFNGTLIPQAQQLNRHASAPSLNRPKSAPPGGQHTSHTHAATTNNRTNKPNTKTAPNSDSKKKKPKKRSAASCKSSGGANSHTLAANVLSSDFNRFNPATLF